MLKKILSLALTVVFFFETTPDDLWHLLSNHHDTIDVFSAETSVAIQHIHCKALQDFLPDFAKTESASTPQIVVQEFDHCSPLLFSPQHQIEIATVGRAPPALG